MSVLTAEITEAFLIGPHSAVVTTINPDGSPHSSLVWVGEENGEIVSGHRSDQYRKHRNVARDPRISIAITLPTMNDFGLQHYIVIEGEARLTTGNGVALLQRLAPEYLGPNAKYDPDADPADGYVLRTHPLKVRGVFPWENIPRPKGRSTGFRD